MKLKLDFPQQIATNKINYKDNLMLIGSCFTENIGHLLQQHDLNIKINPFGILFHPIAIFGALNRIVGKKLFSAEELFFNHELWHSLEHHSSFSHVEKNMCLEKINEEIISSHEFLKNTKYLLITLGTSIIYELEENHKIVSNCHKIDAKKFNKRFLNIDEILDAFDLTYKALQTLNPNIKIIFTVSPVRHWRDGLVENNRSKSRLIYSVENIINKYINTEYFPAYELIIDDLRDYRFFEADFCHPNQMAINYVWNYFTKMYFDDITLDYMEDKNQLLKMTAHKVQFEDTKSSKILVENIKQKQTLIDKKYFS